MQCSVMSSIEYSKQLVDTATIIGQSISCLNKKQFEIYGKNSLFAPTVQNIIGHMKNIFRDFPEHACQFSRPRWQEDLSRIDSLQNENDFGNC